MYQLLTIFLYIFFPFLEQSKGWIKYSAKYCPVWGLILIPESLFQHQITFQMLIKWALMITGNKFLLAEEMQLFPPWKMNTIAGRHKFFFFFFFSQVELGQMTANNNLFPAPEWFWWVAFTLGDNLLSIHSKKANMIMSASPSLSLSHTHTLHFIFSSGFLVGHCHLSFPVFSSSGLSWWSKVITQQVSDPFFFQKDKIAVSATLAENFLHVFVHSLIFHPSYSVRKASLQNHRLVQGKFWYVKLKLLLFICY